MTSPTMKQENTFGKRVWFAIVMILLGAFLVAACLVILVLVGYYKVKYGELNIETMDVW